MKQNFTK